MVTQEEPPSRPKPPLLLRPLWVRVALALGYLATALAGFIGVGILIPLVGAAIDEMTMPSLDHVRPWLAVAMIASVPVWLALLAAHSKKPVRQPDVLRPVGVEPIDPMPAWLKAMLFGQAALIVLAFAAVAFGGFL